MGKGILYYRTVTTPLPLGAGAMVRGVFAKGSRRVVACAFVRSGRVVHRRPSGGPSGTFPEGPYDPRQGLRYPSGTPGRVWRRLPEGFEKGYKVVPDGLRLAVGPGEVEAADLIVDRALDRVRLEPLADAAAALKTFGCFQMSSRRIRDRTRSSTASSSMMT